MTTRCKSADASFSLLYTRGGNPFSSNVTLKNFGLTFGIGSQASNLDVELLYNGCGNYADVPPTLPDIGRVMTFICNSITFCGVVNSRSYSTSASGYTFKVALKDPKEILDNVTVMYKKYYCSIPSFANFINVMPLIEANVAVCPPGEDSENWPRVNSCGYFGNSGLPGYSPENGTHLFKVLLALNGRTVYTTSGEPLNLDLSFLAAVVYSRAPWARLTGEAESLSSIIDQACRDIASDYFVMLDGLTITVVLIDRTIQPQLGVISNIISSARQTGTLVSSDEGQQEIYEESNRIIVGDNVNYLAEVDAMNKPVALFLGYDSKGVPQRAYESNFRVKLDVRALKLTLGLNLPDDIEITEEEMLFAGSMNMWILYGATINQRGLSAILLDSLNLRQRFAVQGGVLQAFAALFQDDFDDWKSAMTVLEKLPSQAATEITLSLYQQAFEWFKNYVDEYYGKKYILPVNNFCSYPSPGNNMVIQGDTGQFYLSDTPNEYGYPSPNQLKNGIAGLTYGVDTYLLESDDNRVRGFVCVDVSQSYPKKINGKNIDYRVTPQSMGGGSHFYKNNIMYVSGNARSEILRNPQTNFPEIIFDADSKIAALPFFGQEKLYLLNRGLRAFTVLFGVDKYNELKEKNKGFSDVSSFNIFSLNSAAAGIRYGVVPMRSNIYVYGPFASSKGALGSTSVRVQTDLNPWSYGGYGGMYTVGSALAANGLRLSNISENASFTLAEPPGYSLFYFLEAGIMIDNINLTYDGSSGVTTSYSFKTFTAKFADYGEQLASMIRSNMQIRNNILSKINTQRRSNITAINNVLQKISSVLNEQIFNAEIQPIDQASPGFLIIGGYYDSQKANDSGNGGFPNLQSEIKEKKSCEELCKYKPKPKSPPGDGSASKSKLYMVGLNSKKEIEDSVVGENFSNIAIMSLDGLLSPVSINGREGRLSPYGLFFDTPKDRGGEDNKLTKSRPSMPPIFKDGAAQRLPINQKYLNPILSLALLGEWDDRGISRNGFNIHYVSWGDDVAQLAAINLRETKTDFGFSALRGPLVLQSWGYDTQNKPVPNIIDSPSGAEQGIFEQYGLKDQFMKNWLTNPKTWPVGPIDLRWDRDRGVWVCPPPDRIVVAQLLSDLPEFGTAEAILLNPQSGDGPFYENYGIWGSKGENLLSDISSEKIKLSDFLGRNLCTGTVVYAAFNDGKYIVLESSIVNDETCTCVCTTTETTTTTTTTETTTTEPPTTPPCDPDVCGLSECLSNAFTGPGILGLTEQGCLTLYELTECPLPSPTP
jgi:hypothetical protein